MNTYTIILERISTGELSPSMVTRQPSKDDAMVYACEAISDQPDLRVAEIRERTKWRLKAR